MKTFKFYTTDSNPSTNNSKIFLNTKYTTDYSKMLDDIILADIIDKNDYLFDATPTIDICSSLKDDEKFIKATKFLANYKKYKKSYKLPFILGKMYTLSDGTPIIFYDDEIQIGFDTFKYSNFSDLSFLKGLTTNKKKTIINIYTYGAADIDINIL